FQAEDGIRDRNVTGVQTCALPIFERTIIMVKIVRSIQITINFGILTGISVAKIQGMSAEKNRIADTDTTAVTNFVINGASTTSKIGRASCRESVKIPERDSESA